MDGIYGHLLVRVESMPCNNSVRLLNTYKLVGIYLLGSFVPVQQFRIKTLSFPVLYIYVPYQLPKPFFVIIVGSIRFDTGFYMKDRVELFQIYALLKGPIGWFLTVVHRPFFRIHSVACHSGIGDKCGDSQCCHHRKGITFRDSLTHSFLLSATGR